MTAPLSKSVVVRMTSQAVERGYAIAMSPVMAMALSPREASKPMETHDTKAPGDFSLGKRASISIGEVSICLVSIYPVAD